ncbi:MAG: choice-of-anchor I family protein [Desulfovibrionaceae bacterium]
MKRLILWAALALQLALPAGTSALEQPLLHKLGTYHSGQFDESAAEIVAYDKDTARVFVVNAHSGMIDVLDVRNPAEPMRTAVIDLSTYGAGVNSVAAHSGRLAMAVEAEDKQAPGTVVLADVSGNIQRTFAVGALPDMVAFSPDGRYVVAACEGEPSADYSVDPEGCVAVIDLASGTVRLAGFGDYNGQEEALRSYGVRISGPGASAAKDLEPEYAAISADSSTAYVTLQENNAIAVVDLAQARVTGLLPLGLKDWKGEGLVLDASDKDGRINLASWPVFGCYMPDAITAFQAGGRTWLVTANEGDSREYGDYADEERLGKMDLDPAAFPDAESLKDKAALGRLKVIPDLCDTDGDGDADRIVAFGARSFSIWSEDGRRVYDSGDAFERTLATLYPGHFNASSDENEADARSDDKGAEPEAVAVGSVGGRIYAFIGLERMGGIMVYDVTNPTAPQFREYRLDREYYHEPKTGRAGDLGPEGMVFVPAARSHTGTNLLIVGNEVSGTTTLYEVR